jgi:hypothetical protein
MTRTIIYVGVKMIMLQSTGLFCCEKPEVFPINFNKGNSLKKNSAKGKN